MLEVDVWRAAQVMIEKHGDHAERQAALKVEQMLANGDSAGAAAWKQITTAIIVLCVAEPGAAPEENSP